MIRVRLWHKAIVKRHLIRLSRQTDDAALKVQIADVIEDGVLLDGLTEALVEKQSESLGDETQVLKIGDGELIKAFLAFLEAHPELVALLIKLLIGGL